MTKPQQPELRRSGHTPVDQDHAAEVAGGAPRTRQGRAASGPVPPDNEPGHHPEHEQDRPANPARPPTPASTTEPARPATEATRGRPERFPFEFDARFVPLALPFGVMPATAYVEVDDDELRVRFGPWSLRTTLDNVAEVTPTGPYRWWKVAGPPRLSLADRGVTFATTAAGGLCIRFREPVPAALPRSLVRHPSATVTVATPAALADALSRTANPPPKVG